MRRREEFRCDDSMLYATLVNWARWLSGGKGNGVAIGSAEGRYRTPPPDDSPPGRVLLPIDVLLAGRTEDAIRESLPLIQRRVLKHYYVLRADPQHTCRRLRIGHRQYIRTLQLAHSYLARALQI